MSRSTEKEEAKKKHCSESFSTYVFRESYKFLEESIKTVPNTYLDVRVRVESFEENSINLVTEYSVKPNEYKELKRKTIEMKRGFKILQWIKEDGKLDLFQVAYYPLFRLPTVFQAQVLFMSKKAK